jgi:RNA-directed DNA polymerase
VPVAEEDQAGRMRFTGGKGAKRGTPQGGVISPLLANIYMNRFLKYWRAHRLGERLAAHVVTYADDLVILTRGHAGQALEALRSVMARIGLTVNEAKTALREARTGRFDFLGYSFGPFWNPQRRRSYLGAAPSAKSRQRLKAQVHDLTRPCGGRPWSEVRDQLNEVLTGWRAYFSYGTVARAYVEVDWYVADRVRHFLRRRHKVRSRGTRDFPTEHVFGERGVVKLYRKVSPRAGASHAVA